MLQINWQVKKRSGELQVYTSEKIGKSIFMAQSNINKQDWDQAKRVAKIVVVELAPRFKKEKIIGTDEIGDCVERILIDKKLPHITVKLSLLNKEIPDFSMQCDLRKPHEFMQDLANYIVKAIQAITAKQRL